MYESLHQFLARSPLTRGRVPRDSLAVPREIAPLLENIQDLLLTEPLRIIENQDVPRYRIRRHLRNSLARPELPLKPFGLLWQALHRSNLDAQTTGKRVQIGKFSTHNRPSLL